MITQEDKEQFVLLQDLCCRLPYNTKVRAFIGEKSECDEILGCVHIFNFYAYNCKPYLRPMSSMTEEEINEFHKLRFIHVNYGLEPLQCVLSVNEIDWLNAHYFDYRNLISKGLALEAPEGMYDIKNK